MTGICLRPTEYSRLKDVSMVIGDFVLELNSVVPCPYRSEHMNQLGFLSCPDAACIEDICLCEVKKYKY
jgi:hypothetical protein